MKGKQTALMPGNGDKVGYWLTPPDLMKKLDDEFHFDFDACPYPRPAGFDGLKEDWGTSTWVNPPFVGGQRQGLSAWARRAITLHKTHPERTIVLIGHVHRWEAEMIQAGAEVRTTGSPEVRWVDRVGRPTPNPSPALLFILRPKP